MKTAIYAGSFDPLTKGHLDIIERASKVFSLVVVLVANNPTKKYTFSAEQRKTFIQNATRGKNVTVDFLGQDRLVADYAYDHGAMTLIKGVRNSQDFDYERMLHEVTLSQQRGIDTHILISRQDLSHVSSTAAKELCKYQGLISEYVPLEVKEALESVINRQFILGITGVIGAGKSHLSNLITSEFNDSYNGGIHNLELDHLAHHILFGGYDNKSHSDWQLRLQIQDEFEIKDWSRKTLGNIVFNDDAKLARLNDLMKNPLLTRVRSAMAGKQGIMLVNGALLVEADYLDLCNNNIILIKASDSDTTQRLVNRGMSQAQIQKRLNSQFDANLKIKKISKKIEYDQWGRFVIIENDNQDLKSEAAIALTKIIGLTFSKPVSIT